MGYEVDFLPVGESGPGGDAIALRIGDLKSGTRAEQFIAIVDGGFASSGQKLVAHVRKHYGTDIVDVVLSTHLDRDHIQGLRTVIEQMEVHQLWMHEPTPGQQDEMMRAFSEARGQRKEQLQVVTASLNDSRDLASLARERRIEIVVPNAGLSAADGAFQVIGPTEAYSRNWFLNFGRTGIASRSQR